MQESDVDLSFDSGMCESDISEKSIGLSDNVCIVRTSPLSRVSMAASVPSPANTRGLQLRSTSKMKLMKQQVEQEKLRRHTKPVVMLARRASARELPCYPDLTALPGSEPSTYHTGDIDNEVRMLGGTAPVGYVIVPGTFDLGVAAAAQSAPNELLDSRRAVSSPLSLCDRASTTTSISEVDELLQNNIDLELVDAVGDHDLNVLNSLLPDDIPLMLAGSYNADGLCHESNTAIKPSASCPTMLSRQPSSGHRGGRQRAPPPPITTEAERVAYEKERIKKDNHNIIEKRRRYKINDCITELATLLPASYDLDLQNKKGNVLQASVDYIKRLKREQMSMSEIVARQEQLEKTNRELALDIQKLRLMVQSPPIASHQPPVHIAHTDGQQQYLHELTSQHVVPAVDGAIQYDATGNGFVTQYADMVVNDAPMDFPDLGFSNMDDSSMAEDGMSELFGTLSCDIAHLLN